MKVKKMWSQVFTMEGVGCSFSMSVNCEVYQVGVQCGVLSPKDGMEIFCFFPTKKELIVGFGVETAM